MANFTQAEAEACTVTRCELIGSGGTYSGRVFRVSHSSYEDVEWEDLTIIEAADAATVESAIVTYVQTQEAVAKIVPIVNYQEDGIIGTTVGDIS